MPNASFSRLFLACKHVKIFFLHVESILNNSACKFIFSKIMNKKILLALNHLNSNSLIYIYNLHDYQSLNTHKSKEYSKPINEITTTTTRK